MSGCAVRSARLDGWVTPAGLCPFVSSDVWFAAYQSLVRALSALRAKLHDMSPRTSNGPIASFIRFVLTGGSVTLLSSAVLVLLSARLDLLIANAIVTIGGTLLANEMHSRFSFRSDRRGVRMHAESALTAVAAYLVTTLAMLTLHRVVANPAVLLDQAVYLAASGVAGLGRFAVLRMVVFAHGRTPAQPGDREEEVALAA